MFNRSIPLAFVLIAAFAATAQAEEAFQRTFKTSTPQSKITVDHSSWDKLLQQYVVPSSNGLNRVDYSGFKKSGLKSLKAYIASLEQTDPTKLDRQEQFAFWANLYNAKTIDIVLAHYPVKSIRDIDISPGLFADGPWKKKVTNVRGHALSLDDIEHNIMRVFWKDTRVHYAVNCASVGCPNLLTKAFTGKMLEAMLNEAARAYVNAPRGVKVEHGEVTISKIYSWYRKDFGANDKEVIAHLMKHAGPKLRAKLAKAQNIDNYTYDWRLNDTNASS